MIRSTLAWLLLGAAPAAATAQTVQQQFDGATAAMERGDYAAALDGYRAIGRRLPATATRSRAVAEAREGLMLLRLKRNAEAETALRHALPLLPATDASLADDRFLTASGLAALEEQDLDFTAARRDYATALGTARQPIDRINARAGLARVTMFNDPDAALALIDAALAELPAAPSLAGEDRAPLHTLKGRILLNAGQFRAASQELLKAVSLLGGLTQTVTAQDVAARSDLAIAALLKGDAAGAKQYLAYSGSGNLTGGFALAAATEPPRCGDEGLEPQDVGVVEFGLADDGSTRSPRLIYSSVRGDKALLFPRAVASWSWTAGEVAAVRPFFRQMIRVELRCSTAAPTVDVLTGETLEWARTRGAEAVPTDGLSAAAAVPRLRAELARREAAGGDPARLVPVLLALTNNPVTTPEESQAWMERALRIARDDGAPPIVQAALLLRGRRAAWNGRNAKPAEQIAGMRGLLDDPAIGGDARAGAAVRLALAQLLVAAKARPAALPHLQQVAADDRLNARDPLRIEALSRLATLQAAAGDLDAARAAYLKTGLSAGQCALADVHPVRMKGSIGSGDYPSDALAWGIGGWAQTEFDVRADGVPANVRTLIAYPPFVFGPPVQRFISRSRYTQSFRPDGQLGCGADHQTVNFAMPWQLHR